MSDLTSIQQKIDSLIQLCETLKEENTALKASEVFLLNERARLIEKNEDARIKVENMIGRLKSLEQSS